MTPAELEKVLKPDLIELQSRGYGVDVICECVERYLPRRDKYQMPLEELGRRFLNDPSVRESVHSVRYRTKDPLNLAAKLARKCLKHGKLIEPAALFNPRSGVTDLGGIRILHLYKSQWPSIHKYIVDERCGGMVRIEEQIAYIRRGENPAPYVKTTTGVGFEAHQVREHEANYASLHYVVQFPNGHDDDIYLECQVRTVFEEGWGEIDHEWRYPDGANVVVSNQLEILNNASSLANDVATALGDMKYLPTFIPWELEQRLERSADEVHCASPSLGWATSYLDEFLAQVKRSQGQYHYWYIDCPEARVNVELVKDRLRQEGLLSRVEFERIPHLLSNVSPLFSDVLLLTNALNPATRKYQDIAIMAAPVQPAMRLQDHLDIVVYDERTVKVIRTFFEELRKALK